MKKQYTIIGYTNDFGVMKNEKTGKNEQWAGKRLIAQVLTFSDSGDAVQGLTRVFKADSAFHEVPIGTTGNLLFDENGRAVHFLGGK